jgi:hypothetical protein
VRSERKTAYRSYLADVAQIDAVVAEFHEKRQLLVTHGRKKIAPSPREKSMGYSSRALVQLKHTSDKSQGMFLQQKGMPLASNSSGGTFFCDDPFSLGTWKHHCEVPPCKVNQKDEPIGTY